MFNLILNHNQTVIYEIMIGKISYNKLNNFNG